MGKKIAALVVVVLIIGAGAVFLTTRNKNKTSNSTGQSSQNSQQNSSKTNGGEVELSGNLQSLRGDGKARECTMSYSDTNGSGSGKMYTDGKGRGRVQLDLTTAQGNQGQSNTLITGDKVYSWTATDGGSFGIVADVSTVQTGSTASPTTSNSQTAGKDFSLKCKNWSVDDAVLTVPANVNFTALPTGQ